MINNEIVLVGDSKHTVEVKPLTIFFNSAHEDIVYIERVAITPEMTLSYFESINKIDPYTSCLFKIVVPDYRLPITKSNVKKSVVAFKHLVGLFSLSLRLMAEGKKIVWKYPEYCLHPKYQLNIADAMILLSQHESFCRFIEFIQKGYFDEFIFSIEEKGITVLNRLDELLMIKQEKI